MDNFDSYNVLLAIAINIPSDLRLLLCSRVTCISLVTTCPNSERGKGKSSLFLQIFMQYYFITSPEVNRLMLDQRWCETQTGHVLKYNTGASNTVKYTCVFGKSPNRRFRVKEPNALNSQNKNKISQKNNKKRLSPDFLSSHVFPPIYFLSLFSLIYFSSLSTFPLIYFHFLNIFSPNFSHFIPLSFTLCPNFISPTFFHPSHSLLPHFLSLNFLPFSSTFFPIHFLPTCIFLTFPKSNFPTSQIFSHFSPVFSHFLSPHALFSNIFSHFSQIYCLLHSFFSLFPNFFLKTFFFSLFHPIHFLFPHLQHNKLFNNYTHSFHSTSQFFWCMLVKRHH